MEAPTLVGRGRCRVGAVVCKLRLANPADFGRALVYVPGQSVYSLWKSCHALWMRYVRLENKALFDLIHQKAIGSWLRDECDRSPLRELWYSIVKIGKSRLRVGKLNVLESVPACHAL